MKSSNFHQDVVGEAVVQKLHALRMLGNKAEMPNFACALGGISPGSAYSVLQAADAAGALFAGITPKNGFRFTKVSPNATIGFAIA